MSPAQHRPRTECPQSARYWASRGFWASDRHPRFCPGMSLSVAAAAAVDGDAVGAGGGFPVGSALKEGQGLRHHALIKKKIKVSLYIGKFRWDRLQSYV